MDAKPLLGPEKLDEKGAATYTGLKARTLQGMRLRREGPAYLKVGGRIFYLISDLKAWLNDCRVEPSESLSRQRRPASTVQTRAE